MTLVIPTTLTPEDVERASERDGKRYEMINGELKEKKVGTEALFIAALICQRLNSFFYPHTGFAVVEAMIYCFKKKRHGRKPDVSYVCLNHLPERRIPTGDLFISPDLVVEVLSPGNKGIDLEERLNEYLDAEIPLVWIVNPEARTIRVYRDDDTTRVYRGTDVIENEPYLPGFRLVADEIFPEASKPAV